MTARGSPHSKVFYAFACHNENIVVVFNRRQLTCPPVFSHAHTFVCLQTRTCALVYRRGESQQLSVGREKRSIDKKRSSSSSWKVGRPISYGARSQRACVALHEFVLVVLSVCTLYTRTHSAVRSLSLIFLTQES